MSQFGNISISYQPLYTINNNTYIKWYRSKKFFFICTTISILTLFTVGVTLFKKLKYKKDRLINSTITTNLTSNNKSSISTIIGTY
jgi:hypothetical protein